MAKGYVYILKNDHLDYVKIGKTTRNPEVRANELSNTSVPGEFNVIFSVFVEDCDDIEKRVHEDLADHRVDKRREFFKISPKIAKAVLLQYVTDGSFIDIEEDLERNSQLETKNTLNYVSEGIKNIVPMLAKGAEELAKEFKDNNNIDIFQRTIPGQYRLYLTLDDEDIENIEIGLDKYIFRINAINVSPDLFDNLHKVVSILQENMTFVISNISDLTELMEPVQAAVELKDYGDDSIDNSLRLSISLFRFNELADRMRIGVKVSINTLDKIIAIHREILKQST